MAEIKVEQISEYGAGFAHLILPHVKLRSYYWFPVELPRGPDGWFGDIAQLWSEILSGRMHAESYIELRRVRLFEWFPRNPGLYHTKGAAGARRRAQHHVLPIDESLYRAYQTTPGAPPDHATSDDWEDDDDPARWRIYAPMGKLSMLEGGIGCVRLKAVQMRDLGPCWFMTAASSASPDEGFPLLVPNHLYHRFIDRIRVTGFATTNIIGRLRFLPDQFVDLYQSSRGIPRLYLEVEQVEDAGKDIGNGLVSVATSFVSEDRGVAGIYATYVTFDPGHPGARESAIEWMENEYVKGLYHGRVLTDFDQILPAFGHEALFSIDQVMSSSTLAKSVAKLGKLYGRYDWSLVGKPEITVNERGGNMRVINKNKGPVYQTFGDHSPLHVELIADLQTARATLEHAKPSADRDIALASLSEAESAANEGKTSKMRKALTRFVEFGEKVTVGVATAAIKTAAGIP